MPAAVRGLRLARAAAAAQRRASRPDPHAPLTRPTCRRPDRRPARHRRRRHVLTEGDLARLGTGLAQARARQGAGRGAARHARRSGRRGARLRRRRRAAWCRRAATPAWSVGVDARRERPAGGAEPAAHERVRAMDADNLTITVEAGCMLQNLQEARRDSRLAVSAEPGGRRQLHHRRQPGHQRGRHAGRALRQRARPVPGAGSGHRAGRDLGRPERPAQGQHRLRPARPVHRQRRHAGHHHRGHDEAVSAACRAAHRLGRGAVAGARRRAAGHWRTATWARA